VLIARASANRRVSKTGCVEGLHWKSQQRSFDRTCAERDDGNRGGCVEPVVLDDDDRPRFAAVETSGRGGVEAVLVALGDASALPRSAAPVEKPPLGPAPPSNRAKTTAAEVKSYG
jgi:hypothetical protein